MSGILAVAVVALCASLYAWTVDFPMEFDDFMYMVNNPLFKDASSFNYPSRFVEFANLPSGMRLDPDLATNFILRPVAYASFHLNYMFDGFNPRWFRVINMIIHAVNSALIFALLSLLIRRSPVSGRLPQGSSIFIPATAALLFVAHPLATESVTYIIQRFTSLGTLFYLLTLWLYFNSLHAASQSHRWMLRTSALLLLVLGMMTKECVFTAPIMAVLIDCLLNGTRLVLALKRALPLLLCLPLIPGLVTLIAMARNGGQFKLTSAFNIVNSIDQPIDHWHYIVTQITVVAAYLQRIVWPSGLNLDPEWPLHFLLLETPVLLALAGLVTLSAGVWWVWRRKRDDVRSCLAFAGVVWFFVTVSISSGLVPLPDLMADHRTYLPSIGIFAMIACLLDRLRNWSWQPMIARRLAPFLAVICITALSCLTCLRNEVWRTRISLWKDTAAKSPNKYRVWANLGSAYSNFGNDDEAVKCFRQSLRIEPRAGLSSFNLSNSLLRLGRPQESLEAATKMIELNKEAATQPDVVYTVGLGLSGVGRHDEAIAVFKRILEVIPHHINAHKAVAMVYRKTNKHQQALEHYRTVAKLQPPDEDLLADIRNTEAALNRPAYSIDSTHFKLR
jgi:Tfp pilus assembly protein PilF